jgi:hypothetical protein
MKPSFLLRKSRPLYGHPNKFFGHGKMKGLLYQTLKSSDGNERVGLDG